jgi:hypothetical protein
MDAVRAADADDVAGGEAQRIVGWSKWMAATSPLASRSLSRM